MEVYDWMGSPYIFSIEAKPIQSGAEGDVYKGFFGSEGETVPIAAKKLRASPSQREIEIEIELVNKLHACTDPAAGIFCFKGIIANKATLDLLEVNLTNKGIFFRPFRYESADSDVYIISNFLNDT